VRRVRHRSLVPWLLALLIVAPGAGAQVSPWYHDPMEMRPAHPGLLGMFGKTLAAAGDVDGDGFPDAIFGAPSDDPNTPAEAVIYFGPGFTRSITLRHPRGTVQTAYGSAVCSPGDLDHNGHADVLVGDEVSGSDFSASEGQAFLYLAPGVDGPKVLGAPQPQSGNDFGAAAACLGDVDGDGAPDILIGAPFTNRPQARANEGQAFVFYGPDFTVSKLLQPAQAVAGSLFGSSVDRAGDVDHDGQVDLIVGAPQEAVGNAANAGAAYVFFGPEFTRVQRLQAPEPQQDAGFGSAVAGVGDVNDDGNDDVLIGEPRHISTAHRIDGAAYLFLGPDLQTVVTISDPNASPDPNVVGEFGGAVSRIGDVDGDGKAELFISAHGRNTAMLLRGSDLSVLWTYTLTRNAVHWGESIAGAGDLNQDGAPDLLVGMPRACVSPAAPARSKAAEPDIRAEPCTDPNNLSEAGLAKIILSGLPKIEPAPNADGTLVSVANVHPMGSTVALQRLDAPGGLLAQAADGGAGDQDGIQGPDGHVLLGLAEPLTDGMRVRPKNVSTGLTGKELTIRSVSAPRLQVVAAALALAAGLGIRQRFLRRKATPG
jgi:VCBS repeat protein/FG-GAP repeat protein